MSAALLTLNAGSSSLKFTLFSASPPLTPKSITCEGGIEGLGDAAHFTVRSSEGAPLVDKGLSGPPTHDNALRTLLAWVEERSSDGPIVAAGHRVVHGGMRFIAPVRVTPEVVEELRRLVPLAPLHQPHNLAAIDALSKLHPGLPQVACFDTSFHSTQPSVATAFALPASLTNEGIRRYGFHGLSYEYIASVLPRLLGSDAAEGRVIVAHLGAGASLCAMRGRRSVATTMGFTALDGLMMGKRCGAIDPGVILYLLEEKHMSPQEVSDLLYEKSGLLGVSGISDDMRRLLATYDPRAERAIDLFVYRIVRELGSLASALGGLDALVFTGGIGEHATEIRKRVCVGLRWLGIELDDAANIGGGPCISQSKVSAWVVATCEDLMIARHTLANLP